MDRLPGIVKRIQSWSRSGAITSTWKSIRSGCISSRWAWLPGSCISSSDAEPSRPDRSLGPRDSALRRLRAAGAALSLVGQSQRAYPHLVTSVSGRDLVIIAPDPTVFRDLLHRFEATDAQVEIRLDRRRNERRRGPGSSARAERRLHDRRLRDVTEPLRTTGWVVIPAAQRA